MSVHLWFGAICSHSHCEPGCVHTADRETPGPWLCTELLSKMITLSCCLCRVWFSDENSNQSSVSDVYQLKVDSSTNSSPSPQQSESLSPAHTSDFRTDDSQPPTLGQEILEEPSLPASEVADEPPTLTKEEPVPVETQIAEEEEDSGAPPLKRFCVDQPAVPQTASES